MRAAFFLIVLLSSQGLLKDALCNGVSTREIHERRLERRHNGSIHDSELNRPKTHEIHASRLDGQKPSTKEIHELRLDVSSTESIHDRRLQQTTETLYAEGDLA